MPLKMKLNRKYAPIHVELEFLAQKVPEIHLYQSAQ